MKLSQTSAASFPSGIWDMLHHITHVAHIFVCIYSGFDSIPSDFGAYVVTKELKEKHGVETDRIDTYITKMKGGVSGGMLTLHDVHSSVILLTPSNIECMDVGTIASMLNILDRPSAEFNKLAKYLTCPRLCRSRTYVSASHLLRALGNPYELMPRDLRPKFRQPDVVSMFLSLFCNDCAM